MKTITIGRSSECDISIEHDLISRRHAILKLYPWGKIEIVDVGRNGTSVNGVKLHPNSPRKIKRSDVVTFAGMKTLDWNAVPDEGKWLRWGILLALLFAVIIAIFSFVMSNKSSEDSPVRQTDDYIPEQVGTSDMTTPQETQETEEDDSWFHWPSFVKGDKKKGGSTPKKKGESSNSDTHDNPDKGKTGTGQTEEKPSSNESPSQKESSPKKNNDFFM